MQFLMSETFFSNLQSRYYFRANPCFVFKFSSHTLSSSWVRWQSLKPRATDQRDQIGRANKLKHPRLTILICHGDSQFPRQASWTETSVYICFLSIVPFFVTREQKLFFFHTTAAKDPFPTRGTRFVTSQSCVGTAPTSPARYCFLPMHVWRSRAEWFASSSERSLLYPYDTFHYHNGGSPTLFLDEDALFAPYSAAIFLFTFPGL